MKNNEFVIFVNLTAEDQKRCLLWHNRKKIIGLKIAVAFFATIIFASFLLFSLDSDSSTSPLLVIPIFIPFLIFSFLLVSIFRHIKKQAEQVQLNAEQLKYRFSDSGFEASSKSSTLKTSWNGIHKVIENGTDFLFFPQENLFFPIPKVYFDNENQIKKLRNHIKSNLGLNAKLINI